MHLKRGPSPISFVEFWLKLLFSKRQLQMINVAIRIVNLMLKQVMWLLGNQDIISVFFDNDRRGKMYKSLNMEYSNDIIPFYLLNDTILFFFYEQNNILFLFINTHTFQLLIITEPFAFWLEPNFQFWN